MMTGFGLAALVVAAIVIYRWALNLARLNLADFDEWAARVEHENDIADDEE